MRRNYLIRSMYRTELEGWPKGLDKILAGRAGWGGGGGSRGGGPSSGGTGDLPIFVWVFIGVASFIGLAALIGFPLYFLYLAKKEKIPVTPFFKKN